MRRTLLGVTGLVAAVLLTACGSSGTSPGASGPAATDTGSADSAEGPTTLVRFVVVQTTDGKPVDIVNLGDPKKKYVTGLKPGDVSDYVKVPVAIAQMDSGGKLLAASLPGVDTASPRNTMVVGQGLDGPRGEWFREKNGRIDTYQAVPPGKAVLVSSGYGFGKGSPAKGITLGTGGKCVNDVGPSNGGTGGTEGSGAIPTWSVADPGSLDLTWYSDPECKKAVTTGLKAKVDADHFAYVLPMLVDATHFRTVFVPVNANGSGKDGVVVGEVGPAYAAPDSGGSQSSTSDTKSSSPDSSEQDDTSTEETPSN
ncbi:hypothetical protein [Actinocrispum wychmicini]|nr:hypothetical protein [Actinocrispum wychmicini]